MQNYLKELNGLINAETTNKESLERLISHEYNAKHGENGIKINNRGGKFWVIDHTKSIADLADGRNVYSLIRLIAGKTNNETAEKERLYKVITGQTFISGMPPKTAPNKPANKSANKTVGASAQLFFDSWESENGAAVSQYFEKKTGIDSADFLQRHGVKPINHVIFSSGEKSPKSNSQNFCYSLSSADWHKKREPNNPHPNPDFKRPITVIAGAKNYIFGAEHLPKTGENLFIFEGENDALCANFHGFNAVAIGGATMPILPNVARELKARFSNIYVLFDANKTGENNGQQLANTHGFIYVDTRRVVRCLFAGNEFNLPAYELDLCDIYGHFCQWGISFAKSQIRTFLQLAAGLNTRINPLKNDRFSVPISHAILMPFNQYISEKETVLDENGLPKFDENGRAITVPYIHRGMYNPLQILSTSIALDKRTCLQAAAGAGKSSALLELSDCFLNTKSYINKLYFDSNTRINRMVIAAPTIPIAEQLSKSFPNSLLIYGKIIDREELSIAQIVVCTYDSILGVGVNENTLLVIDEVHQLVSEFGYRSKATKSVLTAMHAAKYVLSLSATPNYLFNQYFGFKLIFGVAEITNIKHINICEYTGKKAELLPYIIDKVADKKNENLGVTIVKIDNLTLARAGADYARTLGLTSEIFAGRNEAFRDNNPNYNSILQIGKLATKVDVIFTTCLIEAGVSILDEIAHLYICDTLNADKLIQQLARPRYDAKTGANKVLNATIFIKADGKDKPTKYINFYEKLELATKKADNFNAAKTNNFLDKNLDHNPKDYVFQDKDFSYKADVLALLFDVNECSATKNVALLSERLKYTDKTIKDVQFSKITTAENVEFSTCLEGIKAQNEADKAAAISALISATNNDENNFDLIVLHLLSLSKDVFVRSRLARIFELKSTFANRETAKLFFDALPKKQQNDILNENADLLDFIDIAAVFFEELKTTKIKALISAKDENLATIKAAKDAVFLRALKARNKAVRAGGGTIKDKNQRNIDNAIFAAFGNYIDMIKREKRKPFLLDELVEITNKVLCKRDAENSFKPKTAGGADGVKPYLNRYFIIETDRELADGKKITRYILTRRKNEKDAAK